MNKAKAIIKYITLRLIIIWLLMFIYNIVNSWLVLNGKRPITFLLIMSIILTILLVTLESNKITLERLTNRKSLTLMVLFNFVPVPLLIGKVFFNADWNSIEVAIIIILEMILLFIISSSIISEYTKSNITTVGTVMIILTMVAISVFEINGLSYLNIWSKDYYPKHINEVTKKAIKNKNENICDKIGSMYFYDSIRLKKYMNEKYSYKKYR